MEEDRWQFGRKKTFEKRRKKEKVKYLIII